MNTKSPSSTLQLQQQASLEDDQVLHLGPIYDQRDSGAGTPLSSIFAPYVAQPRMTSLGSSGSSNNFGAFSPGTISTNSSSDQQLVSAGRSQQGRRLERRESFRIAPEKHLTLFAMRLAMLEKIASTVGTLAFIWATVVILGGYAVTLRRIDFWCVTVILVTEGARLFSRSYELELQHQDTGINSFTDRAMQASFRAYQRGTDAMCRSIRFAMSSNTASPPLTRSVSSNRSEEFAASCTFHGATNQKSQLQNHHHKRMRRRWSTSTVPILPCIFRARQLSRLLYWIQLASALISIILSVLRLKVHHFSTPNEGTAKGNHSSALIVFYCLAFLEALVFLLERIYREYMVSHRKILVKVKDMLELPQENLYIIRSFFYDVYSACLTGSAFDGLKMDMMEYCITWLHSDDADEQLGGVSVLLTFAKHKEFSADVLRRIGTKEGAVQRLMEMISWKSHEEQEVRNAAAELVCILVRNKRSCSQVAAIPGSIESIVTLLTHNEDEEDEDTLYFPAYIVRGVCELILQKHVELHLLGLDILKNLARDSANCIKIGTTRGLLAKIISLIDADHGLLRSREPSELRIKVVKKSLELLRLLAADPSSSGKLLREEIVKIVFTLTNLGNILEHGYTHVVLQELAVDVLSSLAMEDEAREMIGQTGGIVARLVSIFLKEKQAKRMGLRRKAGEALTVLALQSEKNCGRMMRVRLVLHGEGGGVVYEEEDDIVEALIGKVEEGEIGRLAIRILCNICVYTTNPQYRQRIASCTPQVMLIVMKEKGKTQEAAMGLASHILKIMHTSHFHPMFTSVMPSKVDEGIHVVELAMALTNVLACHPMPSITLPAIRRSCLQLTLTLLNKDKSGTFQVELHHQGFEYHLQRLMETTSCLENFCTFFGVVGMSRQEEPMEDLILLTMSKLLPTLQPSHITGAL